ncbi:DUF1254 domain-containing protein [Roseobacter denitrificans]|uniref:Lipoprotein n=1 Tax=Roseobacter denitrificans (strain ATCC 33942 / OCh 114) TaxID=375451 RepID=Q161X5_ROSDO|nr:DUF1254 domain-containing protein [Roseobacter denitrificans]ABG33218.1 conserved hypothetical protein [Roseobacter denitrificans OCh 114]SFG30074.1 Uncharacterized conserved protein [Roseobacter denitrificans OCh 114]
MKRKKLAIAAVMLALFTAPPIASADDRTLPLPDLSGLQGEEAQAFYLALDAVIWGYPVVFFEDLMRGRATPDAEEKTGNPGSQVNELARVRQLRGPEYTQIATPNNDTLYIQSFMDLSNEPMVLSVPEVEDDRYYAIQLWDPNGDTFDYVGTLTTGTDAGAYALVGPNWTGTLPDGLPRIDSPYDNAVYWGRIGVKGPGDVARANEIQDGMWITPLSAYPSDSEVPVDAAFSQARVAYAPPTDLPDGLLFYDKLAHALQFTPPKPQQDAVFADSLAQIGFTDGNTRFDPTMLSDAERSGLAKAYLFANHLMDVNAAITGEEVNGWRWSRTSGIMGTDYLFRATWAKWFTGGNRPDEAIYMDGRIDTDGAAFDGANSYTLRFDGDALPGVSAFWSLSMYDAGTGAFVANPIDRYSIGTYTPGLVYDDDGSLTITIQNAAPEGDGATSNWLPAPEGGFYMNLRLYGPDDGLATGTWAPPAVARSNP